MRIERRIAALAVLTLVALAGCKSDKEQLLLGTLEWDRVSVPAEASEPVLRLAVTEGAQVNAGDLLLSLDGKRMD